MQQTVRLITIVAAVAATTLSLIPYTAPEGDLDLDGQLTVQDLQCQALVWELLTQSQENPACVTDLDCAASSNIPALCRPAFGPDKVCLPLCLSPDVSLGPAQDVACDDPDMDTPHCLGLVQRRNADLNCDGSVDSVDMVFLVALLLDKAGGKDTADVDSDGRLNFCDSDSDNDTIPDSIDLQPLQPAPPCDDANPCTDDKYIQNDCQSTPNNNSCDDGDACTTDDICNASVCSGLAITCDDGDPVNGVEACVEGQCVDGTPMQVVAKVQSPFAYENYGNTYRMMFGPPTLAAPLEDGRMLLLGEVYSDRKCGWGICEDTVSLISPLGGLFSSAQGDQLVHSNLSPGNDDTQLDAVATFPDGKIALVWRSQIGTQGWGVVLFDNNFNVLKSKRFSYTKYIDSISPREILVADDNTFFLLGTCALPTGGNELGGAWVAKMDSNLNLLFHQCHWGYYHSGVDYYYSRPPRQGTCAVNSAGNIVCSGAQTESWYGNQQPAARFNQVSVFSGANGTLLSYEASQGSSTILHGAYSFITSTLPGGKQLYVGLGDTNYPQHGYIFGRFNPETRKVETGNAITVVAQGLGTYPMYPVKFRDHIPLPDGNGLVVGGAWDESLPGSHFQFVAKIDGDGNFHWARTSPVSNRISLPFVHNDIIYILGSTYDEQGWSNGDLSVLYALDLDGNTVIEPCAPHQVHTVTFALTSKNFSHLQFGGCAPCNLVPGSYSLKPASSWDNSYSATELGAEEYSGRCDAL